MHTLLGIKYIIAAMLAGGFLELLALIFGGLLIVAAALVFLID